METVFQVSIRQLKTESDTRSLKENSATFAEWTWGGKLEAKRVTMEDGSPEVRPPVDLRTVSDREITYHIMQEAIYTTGNMIHYNCLFGSIFLFFFNVSLSLSLQRLIRESILRFTVYSLHQPEGPCAARERSAAGYSLIPFAHRTGMNWKKAEGLGPDRVALASRSGEAHIHIRHGGWGRWGFQRHPFPRGFPYQTGTGNQYKESHPSQLTNFPQFTWGHLGAVAFQLTQRRFGGNQLTKSPVLHAYHIKKRVMRKTFGSIECISPRL